MRTKSCLILAVTALLLAFAAPVSADSLTLAWDTNPEPEVAGYVVHIGSNPGVYTSRIDVGKTTTYVLPTVIGRRYCFAVSAYFAGPVESGRSPEVCTGGDLPPTLANPGAQSHPLGAPLSLAASATDPEGAPLKFSATGLPTGVSIAAATGVMSGTPTKTGTFAVRLKVSDGVSEAVQEFAWTISASVPVAPTLLRPAGAIATDTPTFEWQAVGTATRYRLWVDDAGAVNPRLQLDLAPAELGCTATGSTCRHAPGALLAAGAASWSVRASNHLGDGPWSGARDFSVAVGRSPVVAIATPTAAAAYSTTSSTVALGGTASDDTKVAQVTWSNDRGGAGTATGTTTWSVASVPLKAGANVLTLTARDEKGNVSTDVLTVTRTDGDNDPPTVAITTPTTAPTYSTGAPAFTLAGTASDAFGIAKVTWTNNRGGSGTATGTTSWSAAIRLRPGPNLIIVTARDTAGITATDGVMVTLAEGVTTTSSLTSSAPPALTVEFPTAEAAWTTASSTVALRGVASDNVVQVTWAADWGGRGTASGAQQWTIPTIGLQIGANRISVKAHDASGFSTERILTITFTPRVAASN